jgi:hypothetical protein
MTRTGLGQDRTRTGDDSERGRASPGEQLPLSTPLSPSRPSLSPTPSLEGIGSASCPRPVRVLSECSPRPVRVLSGLVRVISESPSLPLPPTAQLRGGRSEGCAPAPLTQRCGCFPRRVPGFLSDSDESDSDESDTDESDSDRTRKIPRRLESVEPAAHRKAGRFCTASRRWGRPSPVRVTALSESYPSPVRVLS